MDHQHSEPRKRSLAKGIGLGILILTAFSPCLSGDFVGDDHILFEYNSFYRSWSNFPRLFRPGYNIKPLDYLTEDGPDKGTGSVAYRPVLSATYFLDSWLWRGNPAGHHLHNLLWHLGNVFLVVLILRLLYPAAAWPAAIIFGLHPIQTEAVCAIGYRADLLATFFGLASFYFWLKNHILSRSRHALSISVFFYFLAVFSKEPALLLPLALLLFARLFPERMQRPINAKEGALFSSIAVFYLLLYFFVFPNPALGEEGILLNGDGGKHLLMMLRIWRHYLGFFLLPWTVTLVPSLYAPPMRIEDLWPMVLDLLALGGYLILLVRSRCAAKPVFFFALWVLIFYLPVSNLLPNPNPMALRYLYLPSLGLAFITVNAIKKIPENFFSIERAVSIKRYLLWTITAALAVCTFLVSCFWKNDYTLVSVWLQRYPEHHKAYSVMGHLHFQAGLYRQSRDYFLQSQQRHPLEPFAQFRLATAQARLGHFQAAETTVRRLIAEYPDYTHAKVLLGDILMKRGQSQEAVTWFKQGLSQSPLNLEIRKRLIDVLIRLGHYQQARQVEGAAAAVLEEKELNLLRDFMEEQLAADKRKGGGIEKPMRKGRKNQSLAPPGN